VITKISPDLYNYSRYQIVKITWKLSFWTIQQHRHTIIYNQKGKIHWIPWNTKRKFWIGFIPFAYYNFDLKDLVTPAFVINNPPNKDELRLKAQYQNFPEEKRKKNTSSRMQKRVF
jgi:hypothetical protein